MKRIFICGNFGFESNHLDGQTIKTRIIKDELSKIYGEKSITFTDTSFISRRPVQTMSGIVRGFIDNQTIIFMPDMRAFKVLLPILITISKFSKKEIRYIVIGGWLPSFLSNNKRYLRMSKSIEGIYVESTKMKVNLEKLGLSNVYHFLNFREFDIHRERIVKAKDKTLRLVTFSRVLKEKGIEIAIDAVNELNKKNQQKIKLDIFGPIQENYRDEFDKIICSQDEYIKYRGVLQPNEITETLQEYDLLVFPTYYEAEGLPGTIIDSYIAGLPVIASNWAYNTEFVENDITGKIIEVKSIEALVEAINFFVRNPNKIDEYGNNAFKEARKYHPDKVMKLLETHLGKYDHE